MQPYLQLKIAPRADVATNDAKKQVPVYASFMSSVSFCIHHRFRLPT
jgi:hypothetical protein